MPQELIRSNMHVVGRRHSATHGVGRIPKLDFKTAGGSFFGWFVLRARRHGRVEDRLNFEMIFLFDRNF
jgi:hypothetical protein